MAQVTLAAVGAAVGGPLGGAIGAAIGRAVDRTALNSLTPARQVGRIGGIQLSDSAQGAPIKQVFGTARVAGTVIWAARLKEHRETTRATKTRSATQSYSYSLSFAVALCEGPIDGIGRIWADGQVLDKTGLNMRLYKGDEAQTPDVLMAAVEGSAPAYRGVAYVVFEDMDITPFGNRPPNLSFEVIHRADGPHGDVESTITGVCLIPGAGEYVYATTPVSALSGFTKVKWETQNNAEGRTDFMVSLDQLQAALPQCQHVSLVVSWFGTSLEAATCFVQPGLRSRTRRPNP